MKRDQARRDLSAERRVEILEAFASCIRVEGLAGSSMRGIAAEAGVSQPLLVHHFGSRAGLVEALVAHILARYDQAIDAALTSLADGDGDVLLELLFGGRFTEMVEREDGLFPALHDAATRDERTRLLLGDIYRRFQDDLADRLAELHPGAPADDCRRVAYGLMCLAESNELMRELALPGREASDALALGRLMLQSLASEVADA